MSITITKQRTLLDVERKDGNHLRILLVKAKTDEGQDIAWYSVEVGPVTEGEFKPKNKVSIRGGELKDVLKTIHEAFYGTPPPGAMLDIPLEPPKDERPF